MDASPHIPSPPPFPARREPTDDEREAQAKANAKYEVERAANGAALAELLRGLPDNVLAALLREVAKAPLRDALWVMGRS